MKTKTNYDTLLHKKGVKKILLIMKLTLFLILVTVFQVSAISIFSQGKNVSFEMHNATVRDVIQAIETQGEMSFFYNDDLAELNTQISVSFQDKPVKEALENALAQADMTYEIIKDNFVVLIPAPVTAKQEIITVTGQITDDAGIPLPGVNVIIKGTTTGAITNSEGLFTIEVDNPNTVLVFSYIGYLTQEITVGDQSEINISLQVDEIGLEEVIVVGYGTQKKSDITGSVVSVNNEVLESNTRVSVEQMLQGVAAGLHVTVNSSSAEGSSNTMLIRGNNSITASNSPLIIFDGIPFSGNLSEINPNDIESIEVLKDASAAAIYGSRGSNGVILVTSKQGTIGKMAINYKGSYAFHQVINVPDMMDGATFYEAKTERGLGTQPTEDEGYESGRSTDWVDLATQTGKTQQHDLSLRGGSERTKLFLSISYINAKGIAINDEFKRYTFRVNLDQKLLSWITFRTNTQYGYYNRSGIEADFERAFFKNPLGIPYNEDGSIRLRVWIESMGRRDTLG